MTSYNTPYWGNLIDAGKKPSQQLEQLCLGLAKIIGDLEPGTSPDNELTPCRLAAFYRSVGGNYDEIFSQIGSYGLSLMYKTIGCVHSLQPTTPYETPSIPCLKPLGFLRWQTIQLQLDPAEHAPFLQKAVSLYDVPRLDGGLFPRHIPSEAFPAHPDKDIVDWWETVTHSMSQENHMRRLGSSPYRSPHENGNKAEYFVQNGRLSASASQRPHKPSRHSSEDKIAEARRRSSVPELIFNQNDDSRPDSSRKASRSRSAQRISSTPYYPPPPQQTGPQRHATSTHRHSSNASSPYRPSTNGPHDPSKHRRHRSSGGHATNQRRPRSPSIIHESTGSEGSSEDSRSSQNRKNQGDRRRSSLWPPSFLHHHRRHSHGATYDTTELAPPLPPRPKPLQTQYPRGGGGGGGGEYHPQSPQSPATRRRGATNTANVQFRNDIFSPNHHSHYHDASASAPETPIAPEYNAPPAPRSSVRYEPPPPPPQNMYLLQGAPLSRATTGPGENRRSSGSNNTTSGEDNRSFGPPMRAKTVTMGVGGRRYPAPGALDGREQLGRGGGHGAERTMSAASVGMS